MRLHPSARGLAASLAAVASVALVGGACTGPRPHLAAKAETTTSAGEATSTTLPALLSEVAQAKADTIDVFDDATSDRPAQQITAAEATSAPNIPIVFLVKQRSKDRIEVYLPIRPNGSTGWVRSKDVSVSTVPYRIEVELSAHRIRVFDRAKIIVDEPVGVGRTDRPTPGGVYYLKELLQPPNPDGTYGTYAYGLSGFSTVLSSFNGGQGVIGIHGTNDPASIGKDVSSGCIRMNNEVIARLVNDIGLPLGTPVEILA